MQTLSHSAMIQLTLLTVNYLCLLQSAQYLPATHVVECSSHVIARTLTGAAMELALTARTFQAQEAKSLSLVSQVFPDRQALFDAAEALAKQIASKSPLAVTGTKRVLLHTRYAARQSGMLC